MPLISNHLLIRPPNLWSPAYLRDEILFLIALSISFITCSTVWGPLWCRLAFRSLPMWYIVAWNRRHTRTLSTVVKRLVWTIIRLSFQSGLIPGPINLLASLSHSVYEYGQPKNRWSRFSSFSPHRTHSWWRPHARIRSPVASLFRTANQVMNANLGTPWANQMLVLHLTSSRLCRIWCHVLIAEKLSW